MSSSDNDERQREELDVLEAIYGADFRLAEVDQQSSGFSHRCLIRLDPILEVDCALPASYPASDHPRVRLRWSAPPTGEALDEAATTAALASLNTQLVSTDADGEALVFRYLEYIKESILEPERRRRTALAEAARRRQEQHDREEHASLLTLESLALNESESTAHPPAPTTTSATVCPPVTSGPPLTDRKSTFVAHVAGVHTVEETRAVLDFLLAQPKIARATHNMYAYVLHEPTTNVIRRENDDDGESQAGSRLAHLLAVMGVTNVMVVVTRWYGGVQLGADRFKHINNVAREAIEAFEAATSAQASTTASKKSAHKR